MTTTSELQTRLDALKKARDTGVLTARQGDNLTTFRSLSEVERTIAALEKAIAAAQGTVRGRIHYAYQRCKGL
jgi:hypothetical protein